MAAKKDPIVEMIKDKLRTDDRWLVRGILAIYDKQTADEQRTEGVHHNNGVGFSSFDAEILSSFAKHIQKWESTPESDRRYSSPLSPKQIDLARKRMPKYAGQLARIAAEKAQTAQAA